MNCKKINKTNFKYSVDVYRRIGCIDISCTDSRFILLLGKIIHIFSLLEQETGRQLIGFKVYLTPSSKEVFFPIKYSLENMFVKKLFEFVEQYFDENKDFLNEVQFWENDWESFYKSEPEWVMHCLKFIEKTFFANPFKLKESTDNGEKISLS